MKLAYADPPYPGRAHLYPENTEVDHAALISRLCEYDGWALSTDSVSLPFVLALCPTDTSIGAWVRTNAPPFNPDGYGSVRSWEPVIYSPARIFRHSDDRVRDVFYGGVPSGSWYNGIPGTKPPGFGEWVFRIIGASPGDELDDFYPGSGVISRAWVQWSAQPSLFALSLGTRRAGERPSQALNESQQSLDAVVAA